MLELHARRAYRALVLGLVGLLACTSSSTNGSAPSAPPSNVGGPDDAGALSADAGGGTTDAAVGLPPRAPREACTGATTTLENVAYASTNTRNVLDLYVPANGAHCPLVVWIHGGGWRTGRKELEVRAQARVLRLVARGYALASIDYRLSGDAIFPAQINDVKAAIRFLRAHADQYRLDPARVALWGTSAGGHLAALAGTSGGVGALEDLAQGNAATSSTVQGVIDCYGPTVLTSMDAEAATNGCGGGHDLPNSAESELLGCTAGLQSCPAAIGASPVHYVDADDPPMLLGHGLADCTVPHQQTEHMKDALAAVFVKVDLHLNPSGKHTLESCPEDRYVDSFLDDVLR